MTEADYFEDKKMLGRIGYSGTTGRGKNTRVWLTLIIEDEELKQKIGEMVVQGVYQTKGIPIEFKIREFTEAELKDE